MVLDNARRMAANEIKHRARLVMDHGDEARLNQVFRAVMKANV